jgi:hypothetical protein
VVCCTNEQFNGITIIEICESEYYQAVNKLKEHGISYRSRITSHDTGIMSSNRNDNSQYDIYVKKGEEYFAEKALSKY